MCGRALTLQPPTRALPHAVADLDALVALLLPTPYALHSRSEAQLSTVEPDLADLADGAAATASAGAGAGGASSGGSAGGAGAGGAGAGGGGLGDGERLPSLSALQEESLCVLVLTVHTFVRPMTPLIERLHSRYDGEGEAPRAAPQARLVRRQIAYLVLRWAQLHPQHFTLADAEPLRALWRRVARDGHLSELGLRVHATSSYTGRAAAAPPPPPAAASQATTTAAACQALAAPPRSSSLSRPRASLAPRPSRACALTLGPYGFHDLERLTREESSSNLLGQAAARADDRASQAAASGAPDGAAGASASASNACLARHGRQSALAQGAAAAAAVHVQPSPSLGGDGGTDGEGGKHGGGGGGEGARRVAFESDARPARHGTAAADRRDLHSPPAAVAAPASGRNPFAAGSAPSTRTHLPADTGAWLPFLKLRRDGFCEHSLRETPLSHLKPREVEQVLGLCALGKASARAAGRRVSLPSGVGAAEGGGGSGGRAWAEGEGLGSPPADSKGAVGRRSSMPVGAAASQAAADLQGQPPLAALSSLSSHIRGGSMPAAPPAPLQQSLVERLAAVLARPLDANSARAEQWLALEPVQIARFLTLRDERLYHAIGHCHLLSYVWKHTPMNGGDDEGGEAASSKAPLTAMTQRFNELAGTVSTAIVSTRRLTTRATLLHHFISVADELRGLQVQSLGSNGAPWEQPECALLSAITMQVPPQVAGD